MDFAESTESSKRVRRRFDDSADSEKSIPQPILCSGPLILFQDQPKVAGRIVCQNRHGQSTVDSHRFCPPESVQNRRQESLKIVYRDSYYCDGLRGPLIIRDREDPHASLYDKDGDSDATVITLSDWYHTVSTQYRDIPSVTSALCSLLK